MPPSTTSGVTALPRSLIRVHRACIALFAVLVVGCLPSVAQTVAPSPPPIGRVLREIPPDLWHFLSWDTATVLGVGGGAAAIGHIWDDDLSDEIETN
jgi:hypothetical protein